jgi:hypothetical protein
VSSFVLVSSHIAGIAVTAVIVGNAGTIMIKCLCDTRCKKGC